MSRRRTPTHPGFILNEEFLKPMGLDPASFAKRFDVPFELVDALVREVSDITPELAGHLSAALYTSPEFWIGLQASHDGRALVRRRPLRSARRRRRDA